MKQQFDIGVWCLLSRDMAAMVGYLIAFVIGVLITPVALYWLLKKEDDARFENENNLEGEFDG